ncbi:MAG: hypothetical protein LKJ80_07810, partial [Oscillibacter sp.]|nr:hypothetical protein [Oscillibacter sp.]
MVLQEPELRNSAPALKKSKIRVDISPPVWYSNKAVPGNEAKVGRELKKGWQGRKKLLTKGLRNRIIAMFREKRRVPCKLNNVTK